MDIVDFLLKARLLLLLPGDTDVAMPDGSLAWRDVVADRFMLWTEEGPDDERGQLLACVSDIELANVAYEHYLMRGYLIDKAVVHSD
jgi:hypothetical protein